MSRVKFTLKTSLGYIPMATREAMLGKLALYVPIERPEELTTQDITDKLGIVEWEIDKEGE